jgi:sialic acid synthase SpsE
MHGSNGAQLEVIAEIGQNHNGDMDLAKRLIREARDAGASVAKFQVYDARALFPKEGNEWFDYNCKTELSRANCEMLAAECARVGIEFMASAFDVERVGWLEALSVSRYKIASRSVNDRALIEACAATGKRLIVSLGMWNGAGFPKITAPGGVDFLYCISKYPTPLSDVKLGRVDFTQYGGFSDHTIGIEAAMAALARGARLIEKHFTLDKSLYGPDHSCSMTPDELANLCRFKDRLAQVL